VFDITLSMQLNRVYQNTLIELDQLYIY